MDLFSNRRQMMSKCSKNKKWEAIAKWVTAVLATSGIFCHQSITKTEAGQHGIYLFCVIKEQNVIYYTFTLQLIVGKNQSKWLLL